MDLAMRLLAGNWGVFDVRNYCMLTFPVGCNTPDGNLKFRRYSARELNPKFSGRLAIGRKDHHPAEDTGEVGPRSGVKWVHRTGMMQPSRPTRNAEDCMMASSSVCLAIPICAIYDHDELKKKPIRRFDLDSGLCFPEICTERARDCAYGSEQVSSLGRD